MRGQFRGGHVVLERALAYWVHRFYEATRRAMYRAFHEHGFEITPEQWLTLVRLFEEDGRTQGELALAIHRDAPTTSRIVDSMARAGLVTRVASAEDGRTRRVKLTEKGKKAQSVLVPVVKKLVGEFEDGISESDLETTRRTLQTIAERLG